MVIDSLHAKGFEAYAVGGCVRDTILAALESQKKNGKKGAEVC